jgi:copper homeostasis protein
MIIEIACFNIESALVAMEAGAHRIELCAAMAEGGTTPSAGVIALARKQLSIPIHVMIRPRGGDFLYSKLEFQAMLHDVKVCRDLGADGVVFGMLNADGTIDRERTKVLMQEACPMSINIHRAYDMSRDPMEALQVLKELKVNRILSSGHKQTAWEGRELLARLVSASGNGLVIMPGSGVRSSNIMQLHKETNAREFHMSARASFKGRMRYYSPDISLGNKDSEEYFHTLPDADEIKKVLRLMKLV